MKEILRRTWAEIDLDALAHNVSVIRQAAPESMLCGVVKADAYGHGAVRLARELESLGADWFAVSNLEEALQLRQAGFSRPILILGFTPPEAASVLAEQNISQCVYSGEYAAALSGQARRVGKTVKAHIKLDTGMSRLGFYFQDKQRDRAAVEEIKAACFLPGLEAEGVFTHFAVSDGGADGEAFTLRQFDCFQTAIALLEQEGVRFPIKHCANSAAIFDYPQAHLDMVRAGIVLYGLQPSGDLKNAPDLKPVLSLRSVVSHVKAVEPGSTVSYGREYEAAAGKKIATVPVGYADGYPRSLSPGGAELLIRGVRCPIVGRICMDQLMVDVSRVPDVKIGDKVTLIGRDGAEEISADELAKKEGTINYEVVCAISKRVPRVYLKNGKADSIYDLLL